MAYDNNYNDESDTSDGYENGLLSPGMPHEYEPSLTESDPPSNEQTPTFLHNGNSHISPSSLITRWSADQCADWVSSLGFDKYADMMADNGIDGEALIDLQHEDLKEIGITSAGHRLTILKGVYNLKLEQNISIEPHHYVPPSADANAPDANATQDDIARIITQIRLRDERLEVVESDLRSLKDFVNRVWDESRRMREEMLPLIRMAKDKSQPLPTPDAVSHDPIPSPHNEPKPSVTTQRRGSIPKKPFASSTSKLPSPTIQETAALDPSAAATAASNNLTASITSIGQQSPNLSNQPSPTSPPPGSKNSAASSHYAPSNGPNSGRIPIEEPWTRGAPSSASSDGHRGMSSASISSRRPPASNVSTTPVVGSDDAQSSIPPSSATRERAPQQFPPAPTSAPPTGGSSSSHDAPSEFMKSFRVSMEEPCYKVLPVALKKYHINDDWRQYSLYIVHGDQERCLGLEERPLILFKQLASEGKRPMFMLRKHAAPTEGFANPRTPQDGGGGGGGGSGQGGAQGGMQGGGVGMGAAGPGGGGGMGGGGGVGGGGGSGANRVQSYAGPGSMALPGGVF